MTSTTTPEPASPQARKRKPQRPLFFYPTPQERDDIERLAQQEDRSISAVVRRIFRAGRPVYEQQLATSTTSAEG